MASFNRKQSEWRTARDCTAFTSLTLFQFQPRFTLFFCVCVCEKAQTEMVPPSLPKPRRKWCDWHRLKPIDSHQVPPFDTRLLPPSVWGYPSCLLPSLTPSQDRLTLPEGGQLHTQKTHPFLPHLPSHFMSLLLQSLCETLLRPFLGRHACGQDRTTPFFFFFFSAVLFSCTAGFSEMGNYHSSPCITLTNKAGLPQPSACLWSFIESMKDDGRENHAGQTHLTL